MAAVFLYRSNQKCAGNVYLLSNEVGSRYCSYMFLLITLNVTPLLVTLRLEMKQQIINIVLFLTGFRN